MVLALLACPPASGAPGVPDTQRAGAAGSGASCAAPPPGAALTLAWARDLALACNAAIQAARRGGEAGAADIEVAAQRPNPVLSLGVQNINPQAGVGSGSLRNKTVDSIVRVDQLIETANKGGLRVDAARANAAAADEQIEAVAAVQTAALEQAFHDAAVAQERVSVLTEVVDLFQRTAQANQARLKAGDMARADVTRLDLEGLRAQADLREARAASVRGRAELAEAMGIAGTLADNPLVPAWPALDAGLPSFDAARLQRRPDIAAAEARLRAATFARELARAGRVPDVTVGAQAEHYPVSATNQQGSGNSFGVFVTIPLFVRHSNGGEARRAEVDYYAALDERNRVLLAARNELARTDSRLAAARDALRQMRESVLPGAERVAADAEFAYGKGATGVLELLDARRALRQTRLDAAAAQGEYANAMSAWLAARRLSTLAPATATPVQLNDNPEESPADAPRR
ncbi:TolC family protein [Cupriavidus respiraculi]|uniref:Cobalt-zinc-cadmium resistance protein CzcC n=2 Tax=Cupriavidus respiraculi TaxID=195930 RepID=A0ABM8WQ81_9BURK|nr:Cobalt-zinc-cadmium resistance protein CzcC [Cupriavidus respiraculi]